jgi:hypothetical protein
MNTVRDREPEPRCQIAADYFVLSTRDDSWCLSMAMTRAVELELARATPESWITFVDLSGSRVRLRARLVQSVAQCYAENRAEARRFWSTLRREVRADRDWMRTEPGECRPARFQSTLPDSQWAEPLNPLRHWPCYLKVSIWIRGEILPRELSVSQYPTATWRFCRRRGVAPVTPANRKALGAAWNLDQKHRARIPPWLIGRKPCRWGSSRP